MGRTRQNHWSLAPWLNSVVSGATMLSVVLLVGVPAGAANQADPGINTNFNFTRQANGTTPTNFDYFWDYQICNWGDVTWNQNGVVATYVAFNKAGEQLFKNSTPTFTGYIAAASGGTPTCGVQAEGQLRNQTAKWSCGEVYLVPPDSFQNANTGNDHRTDNTATWAFHGGHTRQLKFAVINSVDTMVTFDHTVEGLTGGWSADLGEESTNVGPGEQAYVDTEITSPPEVEIWPDISIISKDPEVPFVEQHSSWALRSDLTSSDDI